MVEFEKEENMKEIFKGLSESLFGKKPDADKAAEQVNQLAVSLTGEGYGRKEDANYQGMKSSVKEVIEEGRGNISLTNGGYSRLRVRKDRQGNVLLCLTEVSTEETKTKFRQITGGKDRVLLRRGERR